MEYPYAQTGRPTDFNEQIAGEIVRRIANGETLVDVCESEDMPNPATISDWRAKVPEFNSAYAHARQVQAEYFADQIVNLADRSREGVKVEETTGPDGVTTKRIVGDMVDRAKLQLDARKWLTARLSPAVFGDRLAHQMLDEHGKPAKAGITVIVDGAPKVAE